MAIISKETVIEIPETPKKKMEECAICLDTMVNPKKLQVCGHKFCKVCLDNHIAKAKNKTCPLCRAEIEITPTIRQEHVRANSVPFIFLGLFFNIMMIPFGIFAVIVSPLLAPITLVFAIGELIWAKCAGQELSTGNLTKSLGYFAIAIIITVLAVYDIIFNPIVNGRPFSFWWFL